jgi:hypothetical protein
MAPVCFQSFTVPRTCSMLCPHRPQSASARAMAAPEKCLLATADAGSTIHTARQP